jgi:hypothetical protein
MSENESSTNGKTAGVEAIPDHVDVMVLVFNQKTRLVDVQPQGQIPLPLAQMMLDEAHRQLDIQRRKLATFELQREIAQAKEDQRIAESLRGMRT